MKYAVISDLHANFEALTAVIESIDQRGVSQIVCLGDVVGYNGSPNECVDLIRERDIPTICGNHDAVACGLEDPWGFNPIALSAALWTRETLTPTNTQWLKELPDLRHFEHFLAVHGAITDRDCYLFTWEEVVPELALLEKEGYSLCFFGHTHSPGIFSSDGMYTVDDDSKFAIGEGKSFFINPGSVGQPRDGDPRAAYGVFDSATNEYELVRVEYPIELAAERIKEHHLPHFLAERLFLGR